MRKLPSYLRISFLALSLLTLMGSCKDYLDMLIPPKDKPTKESLCLETIRWAQNNVGVKADSIKLFYDATRRLSDVIRVTHLDNGKVTQSGDMAISRTYNADGSPDLIIFPDNKNVIRYSYANKKLTKAELLESGQVVQTYSITRDAQGRIREAIGSGKLNNSRSVTTYNDKGYATNFDRYDQQRNRTFWSTYEDFDPAITRPYLHSQPNDQGQLIITLADFANFNNNVFGHPDANGPYRHGVFYSAVDEKGKYNGVTKVIQDISISFKPNSKGFIKERTFISTTGLQGTFRSVFADCD